MKANNLKTPFERFVYLLREKGWKGTDIASDLPVSASTVSRWLSGETTHVNKDKCMEYARLLHLDTEFIEHGSQISVEEKIHEYKSRKEKKGISGSEKDLLYEVILDHAESLAVNLRRLIEIEKGDRSD